ncbi:MULTISPECIES: YjbF family lipoprotein [unclassified Paracoccus (in: a-proteobacteria)]|uniref:YjbF family lipoprotein n=1 Tax=unclassified Paracoccus (in: a-proteobacteria) TaxID=2688777 RepID=UPI00160129E3|nr:MULTISPECIES: YjbF family lipoprotein [unclassified Paracoccus (in: a-proteobacteria)]MBB1490138.1 YjbF family lipoprotein [Paracoccus sp. MC1854]MBB1496726.1 YjbF family lipoprotein [Paracoccus sp. MC1862]QQO43732.1 YjbF family lipoprotein [Paracoccus sp. MC1862]
MNGMIRGAALALALPLLAAGCSGGSASGDAGTGPGIGGSLARAVLSQRQAPAEPAAAPDPQAMAAEALAVNPGPLILVGLERLGTTQVLAMTGENRGMRTYMTKNEQALIMRGFMLTGTRGLGHDLSVAEAEQSAALVAAGQSGPARRVMRYYSGDGQERPLVFACQIGRGPNPGVMVENCDGHGLQFENSYLPSAGVSRQWIGPGLGHATIQVLRN